MWLPDLQIREKRVLNVCESKAKASAAFFEERIFRACTQISTQNFCFIDFYPYFAVKTNILELCRLLQHANFVPIRRNTSKWQRRKRSWSPDAMQPLLWCVQSEKVISLQRKNLRPSREVLKISETEIPSEWLKTSLWMIFLTV